MNLFGTESPLDSYIKDVKNYLPRKNREDIGEELRANLQEMIDDQRGEGISLRRDEAIIALLSDYGHPLRVAAKYQGSGRSLIGPDFYPFYRMSVIGAFIVATLILLVITAVEVIYDVRIGSESNIWLFVNTFVYIVGFITTGYFITERIIEKHDYLSSWKPRMLSEPDNVLTTAWGAIIAVVMSTTFLVILNMVEMEHSIAVLIGQGENPLHTCFFWWKIQTVMLIPQFFSLIFNQSWTKSRLTFRIATDLVMIIGCIVMLSIDVDVARTSFPDTPDSLFTSFAYLFWTLIAVGFTSIIVHWRRATKAFAVSESAE